MRDGYERGWNLRRISPEIREEALFKRAWAAMEGRSIVDPLRLVNLYLILTRYLPSLPCRNIVEFGSYRGGSAIFMATVMKHVDASARIWACDTFAGMPPTDRDRDAHVKGEFADADLPGFENIIQRDGLNIRILKGVFEDTFESMRAETFGLAHIDCDIYDGVRFSQESIWPQMVPGGYLVYDDATEPACLGAMQAIEEMVMAKRIHSEQVFPHFVFRAHL